MLPDLQSKRLYPHMVRNAYEQTGTIPRRFGYGDIINIDDGEHYWTDRCCGIGVFCKQQGYSPKLFLSQMRDAGYSHPYQIGFERGFDNRDILSCGVSMIELMQQEGDLVDYLEGYDDGRRAWAAVEDLVKEEDEG